MDIRSCIVHIITFILLLFTPALYASETYIVSGNPNAPPIVWEQYNELVGLGPDLVKSIFTDLNISYSLQIFGNWKNVQQKIQNGEIDMVVSAYKNKEREAYLLFSDPYLSQPTVVLVKKGKEFKFSSWDSLIGKKGVTNLGESYGQKFDEFIREKLDVQYYQFERALQALKLGEADYLIIDLYTALIYTGLLQGEDAVSILDPAITIQDFHFGIRKDSELAKFLPQINEKLEEKLKNNEIADILLNHYDAWQTKISKQASFYNAQKKIRTDEQAGYLKEQAEMARQRIMKTMVERDGPPSASN